MNGEITFESIVKNVPITIERDVIIKTFKGSVFNKHGLEQIKDKHIAKIIKLQDKLLKIIEELGVGFEIYKIGEAYGFSVVDEIFATYNFHDKAIRINEKWAELVYESIVVVAHELGHHIDLNKRFERHIEDCHQDNRLRLEVNAWYEALKILHNIGFDRWDYFIGLCSRALRSYFEFYEKDRMNYPLNVNQVLDVLDGLIVVMEHNQPVPDTLPY